MDLEQFSGRIETVEMEEVAMNEEGQEYIAKPRKMRIDNRTYQIWDTKLFETVKAGRFVKGTFLPVQKGEFLYRNVKQIETVKEPEIKPASEITSMDYIVSESATLMSKCYEAVKGVTGHEPLNPDDIAIVNTLFIFCSRKVLG